MRAPLAALLLGPVLAAGPVRAQQPTAAAPSTCDVQIDSSRGTQRLVQVPTGQYDIFAGGGVWAHCRDQPTNMYSDSVAWYPERNLLFLERNVHFRDSTSTLDADRVTYRVQLERLFAEGHVYTRNLKTGSDLRGPNLDYLRTAPQVRDTSEMFATSRPTIHFFSSRRAASDTEPFVVVADRTHMRGNDQMWGGGRVTVDRSDVAARGDSAQLDLARNVGVLRGGPPTVDGKGKDAYHLTGRVIRFRLDSAHEVREVFALDSAAARGPDWRLDSDTLDLTIDSGKVQRSLAWGHGHRAYAVSGNRTIVADSLDIRMPEQIVRLVWAYGGARTTSRDSATNDEDWMTGDTLRADFAVTDTGAARKSELKHMTSFGSAHSLYHVANDQNPKGPSGVNYVRGERIDIAMDSSKVRTVDVVGKVQGVYLEPLPPSADTTHADTSGAAADTTRGAGAASDSTRVRPDTLRAAPPDTARAVRRDSAAAPRRPRPPERP